VKVFLSHGFFLAPRYFLAIFVINGGSILIIFSIAYNEEHPLGLVTLEFLVVLFPK
jgi:hypothetical protein